jgi:hypothetical protein
VNHSSLNGMEVNTSARLLPERIHAGQVKCGCCCSSFLDQATVKQIFWGACPDVLISAIDTWFSLTASPALHRIIQKWATRSEHHTFFAGRRFSGGYFSTLPTRTTFTMSVSSSRQKNVHQLQVLLLLPCPDLKYHCIAQLHSDIAKVRE